MKDNKYIKYFLEAQQIVKDRYDNEKELAKELQAKYPQLKDLSIADSNITVNTNHHSIYFSQWSDAKFEIKHVCSGEEDMPDTVEEFKAMKKELKQSYNDCEAVFHLLAPIMLPANYEYAAKIIKENKELDEAKAIAEEEV